MYVYILCCCFVSPSAPSVLRGASSRVRWSVAHCLLALRVLGRGSRDERLHARRFIPRLVLRFLFPRFSRCLVLVPSSSLRLVPFGFFRFVHVALLTWLVLRWYFARAVICWPRFFLRTSLLGSSLRMSAFDLLSAGRFSVRSRLVLLAPCARRGRPLLWSSSASLCTSVSSVSISLLFVRCLPSFLGGYPSVSSVARRSLLAASLRVPVRRSRDECLYSSRGRAGFGRVRLTSIVTWFNC